MQQARIYDDGYSVRVQIDEVGPTRPMGTGFPHLAKYPNGLTAWTSALLYAYRRGCTEITLEKNDERKPT